MPEENAVSVQSPNPITTVPQSNITVELKKSRLAEWVIGIGIGLLIIVVLVVTLVGYLVFTYHPVAQVQKPMEKTNNDISTWQEIKEESKDIGIVLKIPKDWGAVNHYVPAPYGLNFFYLVPKNNTLIWNNGYNFLENRFDKTKFCCEVRFELTDGSYDSSLSNWEIQHTPDSTYKGANNEIKFIDSTGKYTSTNSYTYIFNKSGKALWLTYYPLPGQSDVYLKTLEQIISTIKLN